MVKPEDITIDEKNGKYYIIMHSEEIEFTSNDLTLDKAITIRDRILRGATRPKMQAIAFSQPGHIPPEFKQFFRL